METEATICTGSLKSDNRTIRHPDNLDGRVRLESMDLSGLVSKVHAANGGLMA